MSQGYPPTGPSSVGPSYRPPPASSLPPAPTFLPPAPGPTFGNPGGYPPGLTDDQLRQLPVPTAPIPPASPPAGPVPPRPGVVGLACNLAVTASLLWMCSLGLAWVTATSGADDLQRRGETGPIFHILHRFDDRMLDGLAWPLYLFPLASMTTGFLLLSGRAWARAAHTAVGLAALAWSAWLLRGNLVWWASPAVYIAVACLVLWTPGASRWYSDRRT